MKYLLLILTLLVVDVSAQTRVMIPPDTADAEFESGLQISTAVRDRTAVRVWTGDSIAVLVGIGARMLETGSGTGTISLAVYYADDSLRAGICTLTVDGASAYVPYADSSLNDTLVNGLYLYAAIGNEGGNENVVVEASEPDVPESPLAYICTDASGEYDLPEKWECATNDIYYNMNIWYMIDYYPPPPSEGGAIINIIIGDAWEYKNKWSKLECYE